MREYGGHFFLSPRGASAASSAVPGPSRRTAARLVLGDLEEIMRNLLEALCVGGLVGIVDEPEGPDEVEGARPRAGTR
jgi:hypothetical protein